ncbi:MAG: hypothetical protein KF878_32835 [Planctomycetes bacterium]|nr:hypothetical protein [Planctomycetota bacterium]
MTPHRWLLAGCLLLALGLRAPWLDRLPGPLHPDEAQDAVHAREVLGRPALAFPHEGGGWDEGTYVWLAAPCVALADALGAPVEAAVRLPALLAGLALVVGVALLAGEAGPRAGLLAALVMTLTPWAVHLSRLGLRAALVPPLVVVGLWALARAEGSTDDPRAGRRRAALAGGLCLALAAATYTPARLVVPLLAVAWLATTRPRPAPAVAALALGPPLVVLVALLPWTLGPEGGLRLEQVLALERGAGLVDHAGRAARGWAVHLSTRFLFSGATSRGFAPEGVGLLPLAWAPFLVLGLARAAVGAFRGEPRGRRLLLWLMLAPAAAALTRDVPNALRAVLALPALVLLVAHGADLVARRRRPLALALVAGVLALGAVPPLWRYAVVHPERQGAFYFAGRRELALAVGARAAAGEAVRVRGDLVEAYLRLYAPAVRLRREAADLVAGDGPPRWEVVVDGPRSGRWRRLD